ncbi:MAG: UTP--glucose-1-phosphate uridylyltransferase [Planctomycetaceae bacterium]|nr:MAG: UTP--glucose-1-phosphate uridylyltransferase [Planctomycetaceae bacterium]
MDVQCAVITAAGPQQNRLPLQRFVDPQGEEKTALQIIVEEVTAAGVEQVCVVVRPGDQPAYLEAAGDDARLLTFVEQPQPRGYGEALYRAASFVDNRPFLHLVSDHLYVSDEPRRCAQQLVQAAREENCAVSAVQPTRENMLPYYGTLGGRLMAGRKNLYEIENILEKPTPTQAEQSLLVPGLRAGHYLCLFGMHVLTPPFFGVLKSSLEQAGDTPISLSPALAQLAGCERYLALTINGSRFNTGVKYGLLMAQLALAFHGVDREEILARLVEMLAK